MSWTVSDFTYAGKIWTSPVIVKKNKLTNFTAIVSEAVRGLFLPPDKLRPQKNLTMFTNRRKVYTALIEINYTVFIKCCSCHFMYVKWKDMGQWQFCLKILFLSICSRSLLMLLTYSSEICLYHLQERFVFFMHFSCTTRLDRQKHFQWLISSRFFS